ncbi:MAG: hypothetical protein WC807_19555 [Hyphomicrobium sp.]|jgi:hypothetical protein
MIVRYVWIVLFVILYSTHYAYAGMRIVFYARPHLVVAPDETDEGPHSFIRLEGEYKGIKNDTFYGFTTDASLGKALFTPANGSVYACQAKPDEPDCADNMGRYYISKAIDDLTYERLLTKIQNWGDTFTSYNVLLQNCVHFADDLARTAGLQTPPSATFKEPETYLRELVAANPSLTRTPVSPEHNADWLAQHAPYERLDYKDATRKAQDGYLSRMLRGLKSHWSWRTNQLSQRIKSDDAKRESIWFQDRVRNSATSFGQIAREDAIRSEVANQAGELKTRAHPVEQPWINPGGGQTASAGQCDFGFCLGTQAPPPAKRYNLNLQELLLFRLSDADDWRDEHRLIIDLGNHLPGETVRIRLDLYSRYHTPSMFVFFADGDVTLEKLYYSWFEKEGVESLRVPTNVLPLRPEQRSSLNIEVKVPTVQAPSNAAPRLLVYQGQNLIKEIYFEYDLFSVESGELKLRQDGLSSGLGKEWGQFALCLGPPPTAYQVRERFFGLYGIFDNQERSCSSANPYGTGYVNCQWVNDSDGNPCFAFEVQGHDPGQCAGCSWVRERINVTASLRAVYQLKRSPPAIVVPSQ